MNEQISLFDSDNDKRYQFYGHYCSDDWSTKTAMVNGVSDIVMSFSIELSKDELKKICRDAIKIISDICDFHHVNISSILSI